ncbi:hypothetical protein AK812_SmicGene32605 [Symbiodinium microadriaticum]|uniref:Secreted protein n=1 Tax=Symbiodinium microadriaticum TaxID=2951 RepID=A0A1Q9CTQ1_SYMMI|nr:hypothetical protein AK812_SmicGene32605 [Symbiodinium microadriaticum]
MRFSGLGMRVVSVAHVVSFLLAVARGKEANGKLPCKAMAGMELCDVYVLLVFLAMSRRRLPPVEVVVWLAAAQ